MRIRNYLRGSLQLDIYGAAIERFLNLCSLHNVAFWDVEALDADHFTAWISADGYSALRPYARKTACRIRVRRKRGLPFAAMRATRRRALWLSLILCTVTAYLLSAFVWTIRVEGCNTLSEEEVLQWMAQAGLQTGTRRKKIHMRELRNDIMMRTDKLSYFTVNFKGTQAIITVWERENPAEKPTKPQPCHVVSEVTGVVSALRVRSGLACVKVGDTVQPGELIASGRIVNQNDETDVTLLAASAEADVRTWYTLQAAVPNELAVLSSENIPRDSVFLLLGTQRFPLCIIENHTDSWYDKQIKTHHLELHEDFHWKMGIEVQKTMICRAEKAKIDHTALEKLLQKRMMDSLMKAKPEAQLVSAEFQLEQTAQGAWLGVLKVELIETTGKEVPME